MLSSEEFGRLFVTFERSAFRLETLAVYSVEEEREEFEHQNSIKATREQW
ncbi:DUF6879 family protein [Streptomyces mauvecolor]|uniref:DUF6879 family protein n=1 Tax=Streptomyces mauvecolor TaxID=58345 RepID=A0ABV9UG78_9ACTN